MTGLELLAGGLLQLAAAGGQCKQYKAPHVSVHPLTHAVEYDYSRSRDDLRSFDIDTISPYGPDHHAKIGGLMSGEIRVESRLRFMQEKYPARGAACIHLETLDLIVHVEPTIYIASEYPKGTCQHNAISAHEKQHVQVDMAIAKKYADILKGKVEGYLRRASVTRGPFPIEKINAEQASVQEDIAAIIEANNNAMTDERKRLQQRLDTLEEYEKVAAQCKGGLSPSRQVAPATREPTPRRTVSPRNWNQ